MTKLFVISPLFLILHFFTYIGIVKIIFPLFFLFKFLLERLQLLTFCVKVRRDFVKQ